MYVYPVTMFSGCLRLQLLLIHKITPHSKFPPFAFCSLSTVIVSPQCLNDESPNNSCKSTSFTVSYLIDSCGLSPESAKSASKIVKLKTTERPDSVLHLLKKNGFNNTQISRLIRGRPSFLLYDPEKTLLPKFEFLYSIGFSKDDLAAVLSLNPTLLSRSLDNHIVPICKSLRSVLGSDKKVINVFKRASVSVESKFLVPNITALRTLNVPVSSIELLTAHYPMTLLRKHHQFLKVIDRVKEMGFDPSRYTFVRALRVLSGKGNKLIWDRCSEAYKKWGWSEDDILSAFKEYPQCMILSTDKIDRAMDLFVNKMGYQSNVIAKIPIVLSYNVEKRAIPRCSVLQVLTSKGLIKKWSLLSILKRSEESFLERFVTRYDDQLPQLMRIYRGEVEIGMS